MAAELAATHGLPAPASEDAPRASIVQKSLTSIRGACSRSRHFLADKVPPLSFPFPLY